MKLPLRQVCNKISIALAFAIFSVSSNAQKLIPYEETNNTSQKVKYGFKDPLGKIIVQATYERVGELIEDRAFVSDGKKFGFIDHTGKLVIPIIYLCSWSGNEYGESIDIVNFKNGTAVIQNSQGFVGVINTMGKVVIPTIFNSIHYTYNGFLVKKTKNNMPYLFGYYNKQGKEIIKLSDNFISVYDKYPGKSSALVSNDGKSYLFNLSTSAKNNIDYPLITGYFNKYGLFAIRSKTNDQLKGYMRYDGKIIIEPKYILSTEDLGTNAGFQDGVILAKNIDVNKYGYIDTSGVIINDFVYYRAYDFINGHATVQESQSSSSHTITIEELWKNKISPLSISTISNREKSNDNKAGNNTNNTNDTKTPTGNLSQVFTGYENENAPILGQIINEYKKSKLTSSTKKELYDQLNLQTISIDAIKVSTASQIALKKLIMDYYYEIRNAIATIRLVESGAYPDDEQTNSKINNHIAAAKELLSKIKLNIGK